MAVLFRKLLAVFGLIAVFFMAGLAFLAGLVLLLGRLIFQIARAKEPPASQTIIDMPESDSRKSETNSQKNRKPPFDAG